MEYTSNGYTGRIIGDRVIVHSPDGHIIVSRHTEISTTEGLKMLVDFVSEVA